ncbi:MAG: DUF4960 domain-containing protein, partial [Bacteroidota bacterium]
MNHKYPWIKFLFTTLISIIISSSATCQQFKGQNTARHTIKLSSNKHELKNRESKLPGICFLSRLNYEQSDKETRAAFNLLKTLEGYQGVFVTFSELRRDPDQLMNCSVVWFHHSDTLPFTKEEVDEKVIRTLKDYLSGGGNLFLSLNAMKYLIPLGLESVMPTDSLKSSVDDGYGRKLGFHACFDHPVFSGLYGGAYIWRPAKDLNTRITGYFGDQQPKQGKVIGIDWDYIFFRENSKLLLEYDFGKGKAIAAGAYTWFSEPNHNRAHLEKFTGNIFHYLIKRDTTVSTPHHWNYNLSKITECPEEPQSDRLIKAIPESVFWPVVDDPLALKKTFASENFWDVSGERILTMGVETGGIEEVWAHPFMAMRDYEVGVKFEYKDSIYWLKDERPAIEVRPSSFTRIYRFSRAYLTETIVNDPSEPTGVIHYDYKGVYGAQLFIRFKSNMRVMWPYPEWVTGSLCHGWNWDLN